MIDATAKRGEKKVDWLNDEPVMKKREGDCTIDRGGPGVENDRCIPSED